MDDQSRFLVASFAHVMPGAEVCEVESQSHGEHDFDLLLDDGSTGCVELTAANDPQRRATYNAILSDKRGGETVPRRLCRKDWYVSPSAEAKVARIRREVDRYLADVEHEGITDFFSAIDSWKNPALAAIANDLKIESGHQFESKTPNVIWLGLPSGGGLVSPEAVNRTLAEIAAKPDNLRKLSDLGHSQRHLFVFIDGSHDDAWMPLALHDDVAGPLEVDSRITHMWVGTFRGSNDGVVWFAKNGDPWTLHHIADAR